MNNFNLLKKYLELQTDVTLDSVIDLSFAKICYSKIESSPYENFALTDEILSENELNQINRLFKNSGVNPHYILKINRN